MWFSAPIRGGARFPLACTRSESKPTGMERANLAIVGAA
jgi:hypothetical protein